MQSNRKGWLSLKWKFLIFFTETDLFHSLCRRAKVCALKLCVAVDSFLMFSGWNFLNIYHANYSTTPRFQRNALAEKKWRNGRVASRYATSSRATKSVAFPTDMFAMALSTAPIRLMNSDVLPVMHHRFIAVKENAWVTGIFAMALSHVHTLKTSATV